jgi:hypothetical protein
MILTKSRDFWFALLPVVGPDAAEFFHVNSAVFCRLQLAFNLPQQFSQPVDPQTLIARSPNRSRSELRGIVGCMHNACRFQENSAKLGGSNRSTGGTRIYCRVINRRNELMRAKARFRSPDSPDVNRVSAGLAHSGGDFRHHLHLHAQRSFR